MKAFAILLSAVLISSAAPAQTGSASVISPDGKLELTFLTASAGKPAPAGGQLSYQVTREGKAVIDISVLGLELQGQRPLGDNVRIVSARAGGGDETYRVVHGRSNPVRNYYKSVTVELEETAGLRRKLIMEGRAYDDGVAFRYIVPDQPSAAGKEFRLVRERTQFRPHGDPTAYPLFLAGFRTSYEAEHHKLPVSAFQADWLAGLPLLMEVPGVAWVAITDAHIEDYAGMYLAKSQERTGGLDLRLPPHPYEPGLSVVGRIPHQTPWRVLMIADDAGRLVESNLIINLNPPSAIADTSWIKPGKAAWDWWSGQVVTGMTGRGGMNNDTMKHYIDFAARAGLEYMLIDAGWSGRADITAMNPAINIPELVRYAGEKNVKIWLWAHWTSIDRQIDEAFPLYEKWGVVGVKIDFMDRDDQWMVDFYRRVVRKAAEHHLMIDYHGAYKPDGLRRTYPNLMTREGVLGLEYAKWSARVNPDHDVMLAYTRMLTGPMDYTPGGFDNVTKAEFVSRNRDPQVMGTRAHQIALFAVFESPFQVLADHPSAYEGEPGFEFVKACKATWDETRVPAGRVGDYITVARRSGKEWFVGTISGWTGWDIEIPLSFLGPGRYTAEIYADAADAATQPKHLTVTTQKVDRTTRLKVKLAPGGGHAIRLRPM